MSDNSIFLACITSFLTFSFSLLAFFIEQDYVYRKRRKAKTSALKAIIKTAILNDQQIIRNIRLTECQLAQEKNEYYLAIGKIPVQLSLSDISLLICGNSKDDLHSQKLIQYLMYHELIHTELEKNNNHISGFNVEMFDDLCKEVLKIIQQ